MSEHDMETAMSHEMILSHEIEKRDAEINELKAMVNALRESLSKNQEWVRCGIGGNCSGYPKEHKDYIAITELLRETPEQSLANVKADAIGDAMQRFRYDFEGARDTDSIEEFFDEIEASLRKTMITTSSKSSVSDVVEKINEEYQP